MANKAPEDRLFPAKHVRHTYSKSATLEGQLSDRPALDFYGSTTDKTWNKRLNFRNKRRVALEQTPLNFFEDVFSSRDHSPVESEQSFDASIAEDKTVHDFKTLQVLQTEFSAPSKSTLGLPRGVSPVDSRSLERYWVLVHLAIDSSVVAPLSEEWVKQTYAFIPEELRKRFPDILKEFTLVSRNTCTCF